MHLFASWPEVSALCDQPIDPGLRELLGRYARLMEEFGSDLNVRILVVEAGDNPALAEASCGERLVADGWLAFPVELITRHQRWFDVVRIISDDGSGFVLLVEIAADTDAMLLAACERALAETPI